VWSEIKKTTLPILHYKNGLTGILFRNLAISDSPNLSYLYTTYLYRSIGVVHLELFPLLLFLLYLPSIRTKSKYCIEIWPKKIFLLQIFFREINFTKIFDDRESCTLACSSAVLGMFTFSYCPIFLSALSLYLEKSTKPLF